MTAARARIRIAVVLGVLLGAGFVSSRDQDVELVLSPVAGGVSCLVGRGGNLGVSAGEDGVLLVDDQFLDLAPRIGGELKKLGKGEPLFLVNTHWHGDHTGGNAHFGEKAVIVAHTNVRRRLARDATIGGSLADSVQPPEALPEVTYEEGASLHFNGEEVRLLHVPAAHTDGDTVVWFTGSNVVHLGDLYFQVGYPFVDTSSGGNVLGLIEGLRALFPQLPEDVRAIPGHGVVTGKKELGEYLAMLETITERVRAQLEQGRDADAMLAAGVTKDFDERWGKFEFVTPKRFVESVIASLR